MGLTGAGGTILAVPLLMWGMDWTLPQAAPVALLAVAAGAALGTWRGLREGLVRYRAAMLIGFAGLLVAPAGLWLAPRLPELLLILLFVLVMAVVAWRYALSAWRGWRHSIAVPEAEMLPRVCPVDPDTGRFHWSLVTAAVMGGIGALTGLLSGLLGVGGGFVVLPALMRVSNLRFASCVATTLMVLALVASGTVLMALLSGRALPWPTAAPFVIAVLAGVWLGGRMALRLPLALIQAVFALLVGAVALLVLQRAFT
jgi:hypothetical protein